MRGVDTTRVPQSRRGRESAPSLRVGRLTLSHGAPVSLPRQSLITFVNKHLNKLNLEVTELETQVSGVLGWRTLRLAACPASTCPDPRWALWTNREHLVRPSSGPSHAASSQTPPSPSPGAPQIEGLQRQEFLLSQFWRLKVPVLVGLVPLRGGRGGVFWGFAGGL